MEKMPQFDEICRKSCTNFTAKQLIIVGKNIRKLRDKHDLTQADVAFYIFSDKSLISSLERGVLKNATLLTLVKLSDLFKISLEELLKTQ